jgi:hypothetical protein
MKKIMMMLAAAMLLTATTANAQFRKKDNNRVPDRFHMGIRGGVTSNIYTGDDSSVFDNPRFHPNMWCYRKTLCALVNHNTLEGEMDYD